MIADFLDRAHSAEPTRVEPIDVESFDEEAPVKPRWVADVVMPTVEEPRRIEAAPVEVATVEIELPVAEPVIAMEKPAAVPVMPVIASIDNDIVDLPDGEATEAAVLNAVLSKSSDGLVACPVRAPMCPHAVLAVSRDRRLVLLAASRQGLSELRSIAQAYRWVIENRPLLSMALPQFSIDTMALPALRLLVDHADVSAELLQPMLQTGNVSVQTYRKLRWAGKTGLLLEAA